MKEHIDYLSTLFVGIDIASRIHVISALDFNQEFFIKMKPAPNSHEGAQLLESMIVDVLKANHSIQIRCHWHGIHRLLWSPPGKLFICR